MNKKHTQQEDFVTIAGTPNMEGYADQGLKFRTYISSLVLNIAGAQDSKEDWDVKGRALEEIALQIRDIVQAGLQSTLNAAFIWGENNNFLNDSPRGNFHKHCIILIRASKQAYKENRSIIEILQFIKNKVSTVTIKKKMDVYTFWGLLQKYAAAEYKITNRAIKTQKARKRADAAKNGNTITSFAENLISYSQQKYGNVYTSRVISALPPEAQVEFEQGKLLLYSLNGQDLQPVDAINTAALMAINTAICKTDIREHMNGNSSIYIYLPAFFKDTGINPRNGLNEKEQSVKKEMSLSEMRHKKILKLLRPFDQLVAQTQDESYYRLCVIEEYNKQTECLKISSPYFFKLREMMQLNAKDNKHGATSLFHANIANETNWAAVQLANRILATIVRRGITHSDFDIQRMNSQKQKLKKKTTRKKSANGTQTTVIEQFNQQIENTVEILPPKNIFSVTVAFSTLINDCPQLKAELAEIENRPAIDETGKVYHRAQAYSRRLNLVFSAAYRIILKQSDAPDYYLNLCFLPKAKDGTIYTPTKSTLSYKLTIQHNGKNPNYISR